MSSREAEAKLRYVQRVSAREAQEQLQGVRGVRERQAEGFIDIG